MSSERLALEQVSAKLDEVRNNQDRYFSDYPYGLMEVLDSFVKFFQKPRTKEDVWKYFKDRLLKDLESSEEGEINNWHDEYYDALAGEIEGYRVGLLAVGFTEEEFKSWQAEARKRIIANREEDKRQQEEREAAFLRVPPRQRVLNEIDEKLKSGEKYHLNPDDLACIEVLSRVASFLEEERAVEDVLDHFREEYYDILDWCILYSFSPYGNEKHGENIYGKRWGFETAFRLLRLGNRKIEQMFGQAKERVRPQMEEVVRKEKEAPNKLTKEKFIQALRDFSKQRSVDDRLFTIDLIDGSGEPEGAEEGWLGYVANNLKNGSYFYLREDGLPTWSSCNIEEINHDTGMPFGSDWLAHMHFEWSIGR